MGTCWGVSCTRNICTVPMRSVKKEPYCDGTHTKIGFDGTETADRRKYVDQAEAIEGPDLIMIDAEELCAKARFCHRAEILGILQKNQMIQI